MKSARLPVVLFAVASALAVTFAPPPSHAQDLAAASTRQPAALFAAGLARQQRGDGVAHRDAS